MLHLETSLETFWETVAVQKMPLVLWGAGERGEFYNSLLRQAGINPVCFGDSNPQKTRGNVYFKGVPVLGAAELMERFRRVSIMLTVKRAAVGGALKTLDRLFGAWESAPTVFFLDNDCETAQHTRLMMYARRAQLKRTDFTILANTCTAGDWYGYLNLTPNTPTRRMIIYPNHYLKLLSDPRGYFSQSLEHVCDAIVPREPFGWVYPVGRLGDVELHFIHDHDFDTARARWETDVARVNWDNLFILFDDAHFPLSLSLARAFEALPFANKIFLTRYAYPGLRCVCRYNPRMLWPVALNHNVYLRYERFDLIRWLNEGGQGSAFELGSVMDDLPPEYVDWLYDGGIAINYDLNDLMTRQLGGTAGAYPQGYW